MARIQDLPTELLQLIFQMLFIRAFARSDKTFKRAIEVCPRWKTIILESLFDYPIPGRVAKVDFRFCENKGKFVICRVQSIQEGLVDLTQKQKVKGKGKVKAQAGGFGSWVAGVEDGCVTGSISESSVGGGTVSGSTGGSESEQHCGGNGSESRAVQNEDVVMTG